MRIISIQRIRQHWPLWIAFLVLWVVVAILVTASMGQHQGHFTYALDDAYIHLAIAKNFAQAGIWGVTPYQFSSSSSSILWSLLLALAEKLIGVHEGISLALNILFGTAVLVAIYRLLRDAGLTPPVILLALLAAIFLTSLPPLILTGMEHVLQLLIIVGFVGVAVNVLILPPDQPLTRSTWIALGVLAALASMIRFEDVFLVGVVGLLFCARRGLRRGLPAAIFIGISAALPVILFGLISVAQGWYFLPNSVLIKGGSFSLASPLGVLSFLGLRGVLNLIVARFLLALVIGIFLLLYRKLRRRQVWQLSSLVGIITIAVIFLHAQYAQFGSFYRYEAYLVLLAILAISLLAIDFLRERPSSRTRLYTALVLVVIVGVLPALRAYQALSETVTATTNIYQQQVQMGLFLQKFYQGQSVALNDIGAPDFLADIHLLDVAGLGSREIAAIIISTHNPPTADQIGQLAQAQHIKIAAVFAGIVNVPATWTKAGQWTIPDNVSAGDDTVSFYAVDPAEAPALRDHLTEFATQLPSPVVHTP